MSTIELTKNTVIGFSEIGNFTRKQAVSNPDTAKEFPYDKGNIEIERQLEMIYKIYNSFYYVNHEGEKHLKYISSVNSLRIDRDFKHFSYAVKRLFSDLMLEDTYETIKLKELFEEIKLKPLMMYSEIESYFLSHSYINVVDNKVTLYKAKKISDVVNTSTISKEDKEEIIKRYKDHWRGYLPKILSWLTAYRYAVDKKSARLVILAESNFGKSKLFEWLEEFGEATFLNMEDFKKGGINDKSPDLYENKTALVLDEALSFPRKLYDISDYMYIRPMREKARKVPINAIVLLSRDGGSFNASHVDKQTANRITLIDFRGLDTKDLLEVMTGYTKAVVKNVLVEYLYEEIKRRIESYEALSSNLERAEKAEEIISKVFKTKDSINKDMKNTKDFFDAVKEALEDIIENPRETLSSQAYNEVWRDSVVETENGIIIKRPATTIKKLVVDYDETLTNEMKYKDINQILSFLGIENKAHFYNGRTIRGVMLRKAKVEEATTINKYDNISTDIVNKYIIDYQAIVSSPLLQTTEAIDHAKEELRLLKQSLENRQKNKKVS